MLNASHRRAASVLIGLMFAFAGNAVFAQGDRITPRQKEILYQVLRVDSTGLTRQHYEEFWADFSKLSFEERARLRSDFRVRSATLPKYQRTLWLAARESSIQRKPVLTAELQAEIKQAELDEKVGTRSRGTADKMRQSVQGILEAAAYQTALNKHGINTKLTLDVIDQVLSGIDDSNRRLERLFAEKWQ